MAGRRVEARPQICRVRCRTGQEGERRGGTVNGRRSGREGKDGIWSASAFPSVFRYATAPSSVGFGCSAVVGGVMGPGAGLALRISKPPGRGWISRARNEREDPAKWHRQEKKPE